MKNAGASGFFFFFAYTTIVFFFSLNNYKRGREKVLGNEMRRERERGQILFSKCKFLRGQGYHCGDTSDRNFFNQIHVWKFSYSLPTGTYKAPLESFSETAQPTPVISKKSSSLK
jgi:hypothetical protein